jgi:hypothetical protein
MIDEHSIKVPGTYTMTLGKDAMEYLQAFTEQVELKGTWQKDAGVKECYLWCEQHLGIKYKDWCMVGRTIYFKNTKSATMFRLTWCDLID